jgi:hypothetical protein
MCFIRDSLSMLMICFYGRTIIFWTSISDSYLTGMGGGSSDASVDVLASDHETITFDHELEDLPSLLGAVPIVNAQSVVLVGHSTRFSIS